MYYSSPVLADLDGDGKLEIVVGDTAGFIYAFHAEARCCGRTTPVRVSVGTAGSISIESSPSVADVDGDGKPEVVIGLGGQALAGIPVGQGGVLVLSNTGTLKRVFYTYDITDVAGLGKQDGYFEGVFATPVLANVDDDPEPEILVGGFDGLLYAWNADGSSIYSRDNDGDGRFDRRPARRLDALDAARLHRRFSRLERRGRRPQRRGGRRQLKRRRRGWHDRRRSRGMALHCRRFDGCLGRGGRPSPQRQTGHGVWIRLVWQRLHYPRRLSEGLQSARRPLAGFPQKTEQVIWSSPVLVDLDGDGYWEIIHGSGLDLSGTPSPLVGRLVYAWNKDGTSFLPGANGKFASTDGRSMASFAVGDIDNDGQPELVIATSSLRNASGA